MATKLQVKVEGNTVHIGENFSFTLHRTLRVPQDGKEYPLPASCGTFPVYRVDDYLDRVPEHWRAHGGVFVPMWQCEAMWINFRGEYSKPTAVKVGAGKVCAVTGQPWNDTLTKSPQNYMVVGGSSGQSWLDGFKTKDGSVSQFIAMKLGGGYTAEAQITGKEDVGGVQIQVWDVKKEHELAVPTYKGTLRGAYGPLPTVFGAAMPAVAGPLSSPNFQMVDAPTYRTMKGQGITMSCAAPQQQEPLFGDMHREAEVEMGLGGGGTIQQAIRQFGNFTPDTFNPDATGRVFVHLVNSQMFKAITGQDAPPTPITPEKYKAHGYPWFSTYVEDLGKDVPVQGPLASLKTVSEIAVVKKEPMPADTLTGDSLVDPAKVKNIHPSAVRDGSW